MASRLQQEPSQGEQALKPNRPIRSGSYCTRTACGNRSRRLSRRCIIVFSTIAHDRTIGSDCTACPVSYEGAWGVSGRAGGGVMKACGISGGKNGGNQQPCSRSPNQRLLPKSSLVELKNNLGKRNRDLQLGNCDPCGHHHVRQV